MAFTDVEGLEDALAGESYLADRGLAVSVYLALTLRRPLLLEGEPGVGKTEIARTLARVLDAELIRLQCYEGIDAGRRSTSGTTRASSSTPAPSRTARSTRDGGRPSSTAPSSSSSARCCGRCGRAPARCC